MLGWWFYSHSTGQYAFLFFTFITKIKVLIGWLGFPFFNLPTPGWWLQVMVWMCFPPVLYITLSRWSNPPSLHTNLNVQLLERHLRLTVCAWYTQCMIHSQDNTTLGAACPTFLFLFPSQHHSSREREHWRVHRHLVEGKEPPSKTCMCMHVISRHSGNFAYVRGNGSAWFEWVH